MPLYFFDIYDGAGLVRDHAGADHETVEDAAAQVAAILPDLARDALVGRNSRDFAALVRDETDSVVYRAALLFRGQHIDGSGIRPDRRPGEADHLLAQSRATRAAARDIAVRLQEDVQDLLAVVQESVRLVTEVRAERARGAP